MIVKWSGPYDYEEILESPKLENGLYLATGKLRYEREAVIQYCGITEGSYATRFKSHHKIPYITREQEFWLGKISYPEDASRYFMEMAESIIIYFWQPALNDRKRVLPPKSTTLVNQWFKKNGGPRYRQHSLCKDLDDVLSWDGDVWRTGNLSVYEDT